MSEEHTPPEMLVSTDWMAQHPGGPNAKIVDVDVDTTSVLGVAGGMPLQ